MTHYRFSHKHISAIYGNYGPERIEMYRNLGDLEAKRAQDLSVRGEYIKALLAADQAREYREAALLLTEKIMGEHI